MRTIATIIGIIAPATAFAAENAVETSASPLVWIFAGFCAMVVVAQIVPAVMLMTGIVKGLVSATEKEVEAKN